MTFKHKTILLISVATVIRCLVAINVALGNDEVYYVAYAQHLQWNYFDHPPMVAIVIKFFTFNLYFVSDFFIRLGPIFFAAVNTFMIFNIAKKIKNEQAGFIASLLFTASCYASIIAGLFIMPDAPQLFFWIASVYVLTLFVCQQNIFNNSLLLLFGALVGLCIMSKVHGIFLWVGFGLYILFYDRNLLKNGYLYLSICITLLIISPILLWNIDNNFITYTFHSQRVIINKGLNPTSFFRELLGGFFYNNPINYVLIVLSLIGIYKHNLGIAAAVKRLYLLLSLPLIFVLLSLSLFRDTLPHWSGPAFTTLIILASCYGSDLYDSYKVWFYKWSIIAAIFIFFISIAGISLINFYPGTLGDKKIDNLGQGDFTLDMYQWDFFEKQFEKIHKKNLSSGITKTNFIVNNKWFPSAHIDNYIAKPLQMDFVAIGSLEDIHTYHWLNKYRRQLKKGNDAYYITFSNSFKNPHDL